ncbi:MAG: 4Fe-4S binding protein [Bacteroidales bacterium]|nr:4Fe-4S binding protein [Bacteroidales bacterium]
MKRKIITINENLCTGCGICADACAEGAIQIIDGKARLISEILCDGLGACIGSCPEGAITIEEKETEPYDEIKVIRLLIEKGENTVKAHLKHLKEHQQSEWLKQAVSYLLSHKHEIAFDIEKIIHEIHHYHSSNHSGCPGSKAMQFNKDNFVTESESALTHWPIQMHLISPHAPYFQNADIVLAADCVAYALGSFHAKYLKNKRLIIACPKLDQQQEIYLEKLIALINEAHINTLTVMIMEVPCCRGLLSLAQEAVKNATNIIPIKLVVVGIQGHILKEQWI